MILLNRLEKKFGRYALPNVTIYLIAGQSLFYVLILTGKIDLSRIWLSAELLMGGEWWRLATFLFNPPGCGPLCALLGWYLFYLMGTALEELWGDFRYNLFILTGFILAVAVSFIIPQYPMSNLFIGGSVFLAFAFLFPDFQLLLFFILPVRIKWLALLTWIGYGYLLLFGGWSARLLVFASIGNFLLFFARDIFITLKYGKRQLVKKSARFARRETGPFHSCTVCGITDKTHPRMDFRYCTECKGQQCYCSEHINTHEHVKG
jgi:hypothetical protein